ncbi:MAG: radical SAM protein [Candidatus Thermoplasmatota archaeon]
MLCSRDKVCSFYCAYCQLGKTKQHTTKRKRFVSIEKMMHELSSALNKVDADVITFSGTGEPTLAKNLDEAIKATRRITDLQLAILTNGSLLYVKDVRTALCKLDIVVAKLDAPNQSLFQEINRPVASIRFENILDGLKEFRKEFSGKLALEMMFIDENREYADRLAMLARDIKPDEIQLNTPLRPSPKKPLSPKQMESLEKLFEGLPIISVYKCKKPIVKFLNKDEVLRRRGISQLRTSPNIGKAF